MGVIARQSIKTTIVNFAGAFIGMISILAVYPLREDALGYAQFLYNAGSFLTPVAGLGLTMAAIRFYTETKKDDALKGRGFLLFLIIGVSLGFILLILLYSVFKNSFYQLLDKAGIDSKVFAENEFIILTLTWMITMVTLLTNYISNYGRITVPSMLHNVGYKVYLPLVVLCVYYGVMQVSAVGQSVIFFHVLVIASLLFYLQRLGGLNLSFNPGFFTKKTLRPIATYSLFNALTIIGAILVYRIDIIMISGMLDYTQAGIYFMILTMASVIDIPSQALNNITGPIISKSWLQNDLTNIDKLYKKSSVNLLIAGGLLFLGIWYCFGDLASISSKPEVFKGGQLIFLFLAGTKLTEQLTSVNNPIINFSSYYKYNLAFILSLGILNVFLNFYLIGKYQALGAAMASFISMGLFNIMKITFIYLKLKMHPFSLALLSLLGIFMVVFVLIRIVPFPSHPVTAIILKAGLISLAYGLMIYFSGISEDINAFTDNFILRVKKLLRF